MLNYVSEKILKYLEKNKVIDLSDEYTKEYYTYGAAITISSITNITLIILLSLIFHDIFKGVLFLSVFIPTRQYTGGYHASTFLRCNLIFGCIYIFTVLASMSLHKTISVQTELLLLACEIILVYFLCPVPNRNKPISHKNQYRKYKYLSCVFFLCWGILGLSLKSIYGTMILCTLHLIVVLGILGMIKERRHCHENEQKDCIGCGQNHKSNG